MVTGASIQELVALAQEGDRKAFEALVERFEGPVRAAIATRIGPIPLLPTTRPSHRPRGTGRGRRPGGEEGGEVRLRQLRGQLADAGPAS